MRAGFIKLLVALGVGVSLLAPAAVVVADPTSHGKKSIKTTLGGRAEVYPSLRAWFSKALEDDTKLTADDRYPEAIDDLRMLLEKHSLTRFEIARAQQTLSSYYYVLGKYQQAYDATRAAVAANGLDNFDHLQAMYKGAQLLNLMDRFKESAADFDQYEKEAPRVAGSEYLLQAFNYFFQQDYKTANLYMDKAFATGDMPAPNWYQFKASSMLLDGDFDGAVAYAKQQMARQPANEQWMLMLVEAYVAMQKYPEALALINDAKTKGRLNTETELIQLYQLYAQVGRYVEAVDAIDAALAAGQLHADLRTLNAKGQYLYEAALQLQGKPEARPLVERAIDTLNQAVTVDPTDGNAEFWLGQIATFAQGDNRKAREYFIAALGKKLKHAGLAWYYLGGVENYLDHDAAAKGALQEALKDPESKDVAERYLKGMK